VKDPVASANVPAVGPALRLALLGAAGLVAAYLGFLHFPVATAQSLLRQGGFYLILLTFVLWIVALGGAFGPLVPRLRGQRREWLAAAGVIALLTGMAVCHETFRSKILYDEYVLQATAFNLHYFRDNSAVVRGYELGGVFLSIDSYLDKRPVFFPFLLSLVHDVTGYRIGNVFALNTGLFVLTLALVYAIGRQLNGWRGGILAVALLGSLPLCAQNASGAGMELLNLCMLVGVVLLAAAWLREPGETRLSALVLGTVLLVQSRYESAIYVAPAALAILLGWWRARRIILSWPAVISPLLLLPVALQQKVISASPIMWELRENQTSRFSVEYLEGNLRAAWEFFTSPGLALANSRLLAALGVVAALIVIGRVAARWRDWLRLGPMPTSLLLFGGGIATITAMIMFYYWAALNDPMAARFALPFCLLLILCVVAAAAWADRRVPASVVVLGAVAAFTLAVSAPKQSYHFYSHLGNDEIEWERRTILARPGGPRLILSNKSTLPWMITATPAILLQRAALVADRLEAHLRQPDFHEILVTQSARPTSADGGYQLVPEEALPPWFQLELLAERRFGTKLARISRVVAIHLPADFKPSNPPPVTGPEGPPQNLEQ
jgi:hypothetical protein